jgi:protein O-mannosyl-transferase
VLANSAGDVFTGEKMRKHGPLALAVFALACLVYSNSIRNDFNFDDTTIIRNNSLVRLSNLPKIFVSNYWANTPFEKGVLLYRPLPVATFALDRALWGDNPAGFHLTNVLINAVDAALVLVLLVNLFGDRVSPWALALCALLFAFHPVHTEAINMVVGRTELLAALFGLLTFICYLKGRKPAAVAFFFLALLCKESAVTIPAVIFLYEYLFKKRLGWVSYAIFAGVLLVYLAIRFAVLGGFTSVHQAGMLDQQNVLQRAFTVIKTLGYYLRLLVIPYPLTPDYSDVPLPASVLAPGVMLPLLVIVALLALAWTLRRPAAGMTLAILCFFITILPVSNIISIGAFLGERFLYLPSLSISLLAAAMLLHSPDGRLRKACLVAYGLVCAVFALLTFERNFAWRNADTLWERVLVHQPDNPRAHFHLAVKYEEQKHYEQALDSYERAVRHYSDHNWHPDSKSVAAVKVAISRICYNLAVTLYKEQRFDASLAYCQRSLTNNDQNAEAYVVTGNIYVQKGDLRKAAEMYEAALKANPEQFEARENLKRIRSL